MQMKILGAGALLMAGWLWFYLFVRQFLFNFFTAYPLIKKMQAAQEGLIAIGAKRYTTVSVISCAVVCAIVIAIVVAFCPWYFIACFFGGALEVSELPGQLHLPTTPGTFQQAFIVPGKAVGGTDERILTGIQ